MDNDKDITTASTFKKDNSTTLGYTSVTSKVDVQMRWFFLGLVTLWIIAAIVCTFVALCLTKNLLCLSGYTTLAPPVYILYRITKYLFPKHDGDYQIELEKIKAQCISHEQPNKQKPQRRTIS